MIVLRLCIFTEVPVSTKGFAEGTIRNIHAECYEGVDLSRKTYPRLKKIVSSAGRTTAGRALREQNPIGGGSAYDVGKLDKSRFHDALSPRLSAAHEIH
jgi:hypothetical protein